MDARMVRTREALTTAIGDLLVDSEERLPSITDVCSAAGVSRPTFYQHFADVSSLVQAAAVERLLVLFDRVVPDPAGEQWEATMPRVVSELLDSLFADADFYGRVLRSSNAHAFQERVVEFLAARLLAFSPLGDAVRAGADERRLQRSATFLAAGATWLVVGWLLEADRRPSVPEGAEEIADLLVASITAQRRAAAASTK
jgi:AcrR family transcriptional regulator